MGIARNLARLVPNGSGLLPNANIEAVAASKLTGQVPDANAPSGSVIQVVQAFKSDTFTSNPGAMNWTDVTGLSLSITPSSASSKFFIQFTIMGGTGNLTYIRIVRNSTAISIGDSAGSRPRITSGNINDQSDANRANMYSGMFLDSPSTTSAITYKLQIAPETSNETYINRSRSDQDNNVGSRATSNLIVMEISA